MTEDTDVMCYLDRSSILPASWSVWWYLPSILSWFWV